MHEVNEFQQKTDELLSQLAILVDAQMATMVQISKIYDLMAFGLVATTGVDYTRDLEQVLDGHEQGYMASTEPLLRGFAAPDPVEEESPA